MAEIECGTKQVDDNGMVYWAPDYDTQDRPYNARYSEDNQTCWITFTDEE